MDSGFYAACAGLRAQNQALEVVAHNLANLDPKFINHKGHEVTQRCESLSVSFLLLCVLRGLIRTLPNRRIDCARRTGRLRFLHSHV